jgi:hypothetical protein
MKRRTWGREEEVKHNIWGLYICNESIDLEAGVGIGIRSSTALAYIDTNMNFELKI